jgi:hypothetical protein
MVLCCMYSYECVPQSILLCVDQCKLNTQHVMKRKM